MEVLPAPRKQEDPPPWVNLKTINDIRVEMAAVYREAKGGRMDVQDATRFVYILTQIQKAIESGDIARRVELIELTMKERKIR